MKKEIIAQSILLIFQICILIYILSICKKIDDIDHEMKNIKNNTTSTTEEVKREWYYHRCEDIGDKIETSYYETNLPTDCVHPYSESNTGIYYNAEGKRESYYYYQPHMVNYMREFGYSEDEYPYWVRDDGVQMFGEYVVVAADPSIYYFGDLIPTSLGMGMVCDLGGVSEEYYEYVDIGTIWR